MKAIISLVLLFFVVSFSQSFEQQWAVRYNGSGNTNDFAYKIVLDNSGNAYVTGYSTSATTGKDMFTMKYNSNGLLMWTASYNGPINAGDYSFAIVVDQNGNSYVTGRSDRGASTFSDITTIKYDVNGNQQWVALYDGAMHSVDEGEAIYVDNAGNVYVTGQAYESSGTSYDIVTIKYNSMGAQQWVKIYNGSGNNRDVPHAIDADNSGNIYVCGESVIVGSDYVLLKYTSGGTQAWVRTYNGPVGGGDGAYTLGLDASGNIYVSGGSDGGVATSYDIATIKYDGAGNQLWLKRFNGVGSRADFANSMDIDNNGNVLVTGTSIGTVSQTDSNYATLKYTSNGVLEWSVYYTRVGSTFNVSRSVTCDNEGNIYVTGYSRMIASSDDYTTIKYSPDGIPLWIFVYNGPDNSSDFPNSVAVDNNTGSVYITGRSNSILGGYDYTTIKYGELVGLKHIGTSVPNSFGLFQNYPNPFNPETRFKFDIPKNSQVDMIVFDVQGKSVVQKNFGVLQPGEYEYIFDAAQSGLSSGVYFYRIIAGEFVGTKKMVLVK